MLRSPNKLRMIAAAAIVVATVSTGASVAFVALAIRHADAGDSTSMLALPISSGVEVSGGRITRVVPGGPAWTAGLRPGWLVESLPGESGTSAVLSACGPEGCFLYFDLQTQARIAGRLPFGALAAASVVLGAAIWRRRPRLAGILAIAGLAISAPTYGLLGHVPLFPALYVVALIAPAAFMRMPEPSRLWTVLLLVATAVAAGWGMAWSTVPALYEFAEIARVGVIAASILAGIGVASGFVTIVDVPIVRRRGLDAATTLGILAFAGLAWWLRVLPDGYTATAAAVIAALAYFAFRRRIGNLLTRVRFAELGQRASLQALEAERSRVARDLHDVPLQELTAVIHRLDRLESAAVEAARLREIAAHLRSISVSLRPPVLDDLGLGAAISDLADRLTTDGAAPIRVSLEDETSIDHLSRPPADVELAVFRIVQEAVGNAQRHAGASVIAISGAIGPDWLRVAVTDDGRGIDRESVVLAERAGRLGMGSMRDRAAIVGARLSLSAGPAARGTSVEVEWKRR